MGMRQPIDGMMAFGLTCQFITCFENVEDCHTSLKNTLCDAIGNCNYDYTILQVSGLSSLHLASSLLASLSLTSLSLTSLSLT